MEQEKNVTADDIQIDLFGNGSHNRLRSHAHRHSIRCFKHCSKFVFCFELPDTCPVCESSLLTSEIRVPNFIYPSPLEHEHTSCSAILVRPSQGKSFLHDYGNGDDLHCGLLDEEGSLHDFDEKGLSTSGEWLNCIHIPLDYPLDSPSVAQRIGKVKAAWLACCPRYDPETANCFSFVLFCLRNLGLYSDMTEHEFIVEVVLPRTSEAARYIALYRQLVAHGGVYVKDSEHFHI